MIKKTALFLLLSFASNLSAQRLFDNSKDYDIFHHYTRWGIQLDGLAYFPAQITQTDAYSFKSQYALGYKFGLIYNLNMSNHFGFKIGALAGQVPAINTYFKLTPTQTGHSQTYEHKTKPVYSPIFNFSFPILLEYRNFSFYRYTLSFAAGMQIERTTAASLTDSYQNYYYTSVSNPGKWNLDFILKAGWYYQFKPFMLQTSVVYKHRFKEQYSGIFLFENLQNLPDVSGEYVLNGDYIGLSFDFYFRKKAREVAMSCRANTQSAQVKKRQERARREKEKAKKQQEKLRKKKEKEMRKKAKKKWIFW